MFYEINKTTETVVETEIGNTENVRITEVIKKGFWYLKPQCVVQQLQK